MSGVAFDLLVDGRLAGVFGLATVAKEPNRMTTNPPPLHALDTGASRRIDELADAWRILQDRFSELREAASKKAGVYNVTADDGGCWFEVGFGGRTVRFDAALWASASSIGARVSCSLRLQAGFTTFTLHVFFSFEIDLSGNTSFTADKGRIVALRGHPDVPTAIVDHVMVTAMNVSLDDSPG